MASVQRRPAGRSTKRTNPQFTTAFLTVLVAGLAIYAFMSSPLFKVSKVQVEGTSRLSSEEVVILSGIGVNDNIFRLSTHQIEKRIAESPRIESVDVIKSYPSTLLVKVVERRPVVLIPYSTYYLEVDGVGVPVSIVSDLGKSSLPLMTGRPLQGVSLGRAITDRDFIEALAVPSSLSESTLAMLSEINGSNVNDITLYTVDGVKIRWGAAVDSKGKADLVGSILASIRKGKLSSSYVDISSPETPVVSGKPAEKL